MRNVVLLCLDTVRKDYFDAFAPRLQERADTVYEQARAPSCWTVPSHASMLSGELPHVHGVHTHSREFTMDRSSTFLSDLPGHTHVGISTNVFFGPGTGADALFDVFEKVSISDFRFDSAPAPEDYDLSEAGYASSVAKLLGEGRPLRGLANGVLSKYDPSRFLFSGRPWPEVADNGTERALSRTRSHVVAEETPGSPVFAFINLMEAHTPMYHHVGLDGALHSVPHSWTTRGGPYPYTVNENLDEYGEYMSNWTQLYGASIDYLDRLLVPWIEELQRATDNETTFVVTADHGQNLGVAEDEPLWGHVSSLSEAVLHVPLLVVDPPSGYPDVDGEMASLLALGDLLVGLATERPFEFDGDPVRAEVIGHTGRADLSSNHSYWDRLIRCVYEDQRKVGWDSLGAVTEYELDAGTPCTERAVDRRTDRIPEHDASLFDADVREAKRTAVERGLNVDDADLDERTRARLADLGYV